MTTMLQRLKTEWAAQLQSEAIQAACEAVGCIEWRDRLLNPIITVQAFLLQMLHGNTRAAIYLTYQAYISVP